MPMTVPCGNCIGCRIDKSRQWALRCVHEAKLHALNSFVTFTYDENNLPYYNNLYKSELQLLLKRIRKQYGQFRYYACGEYGDTTSRPHFHVIFFGIDFSEDRKYYKQTKGGEKLYKSEKLNSVWGNGFAVIGNFNYATAAYTARYVMKKVTGKSAQSHYTRTDIRTGEVYQLNPEFALMSLKPGLGSGWYEKFKTDAFPSDFLVHQGKKHSVPRFYTDKLKREDETTHTAIKIKRKKAQAANKSECTPDRLRVREDVKLSKIKTLTRSI